MSALSRGLRLLHLADPSVSIEVSPRQCDCFLGVGSVQVVVL